MLPKEKRLFIFDQSLKDMRGHHFTLTRNITLSAQKHGYSVYWLCSSAFKFEGDMNVSNVNLRPVLKTSMYDAYKDGAETIDNPEKLMVESLLAACKTDSLTAQDRLLFHTADGLTYLAIAELMNRLKPALCPIIHICTPYDPVGVMPNRRDAKEISDMIAGLDKADLVNKKIFFYGENELLATHLEKLWGVNVRPLCLPAVNFENNISKTAAIQFRREVLGIGPNVFLSTYLGSARLEKGYHYLPYIVSRSFELIGKDAFQALAPRDLHFAFQSSPQVIGYNPTIKNAIIKMSNMPEGHVTLLKDVMTNETYATLLYASDLIILPYEQEKYRVRGSGIVTEALSAKKILAATEGSYPGYIAKKSGGVTADTPVNFAKAILNVMRNREYHQAEANNSALAYHNDNHYGAYWIKCMDAEAAKP